MPTKNQGNIAAVVSDLVRPIADTCGLTLWDVLFEKEGSAWFLRVTVDKEGGLDMKACEEFTRRVNPVLDEADPIDQAYYLEIGSPGLGRRLRTAAHYEASIGREVCVHTIRPLDGQRDFFGVLSAFADKTVTLTAPDGSVRTFALPEVSFTKYNDDNF